MTTPLPNPTGTGWILWVLLALAAINLVIAKICLWRAVWHLHESRKLHNETERLLNEVQSIKAGPS